MHPTWIARALQNLLDLRLGELDVLLGDRVVFLLLQLVGHRARVLLGHVVVAGVGARDELDLDGDGLGHDVETSKAVKMMRAGNPRPFARQPSPEWPKFKDLRP